MQRKAFVMKIKPGVKEEYKDRHDHIWPEMKQMLKDAGLRNYSIWMLGDDTLFGYYETDDDDFAVKFQTESEIGKKWEAHMADMLATQVMPDGSVMPIKDSLDLMFLLE
ncbi:MAG: L-rhamnose mutarotase [Firmicutes bacterium]|nr:L-rhamnose mutarotase [Bacillota bacterium]